MLTIALCSGCYAAREGPHTSRDNSRQPLGDSRALSLIRGLALQNESLMPVGFSTNDQRRQVGRVHSKITLMDSSR
jgi:hypothetical protein